MAVITGLLSTKENNLIFFPVFLNKSKPKSFAIVLAVAALPPLPAMKSVFFLLIKFLKKTSNFNKLFLSILFK